MFAAIDLKSFYASVECVERGLDPLTTNLVVADSERTEKTICLAVTPSLKAYGLSGRSRLFEVSSKIREINALRKKWLPSHKFLGKSCNAEELKEHLNYEVDYIVALPRMKLYMDYSIKIYNIYLKYVAPEDIFAYSVDEVFIDISKYLSLYHVKPEELVTKMILDVYQTTGITATSGLGTNLYLSKVAMDILAKHAPPNELGVRIAFLDEMKYKKELWTHRPLTDFWRVGPGYAKRLEIYQMFTMGDIARCSLTNESLLYQLFGVNAELLIDHSWGLEWVTIEDIKKYQPEAKSLSQGQVLSCGYSYEKARLIILEMAEEVALSLTSKKYKTNLLVLDIHYDKEGVENYKGSVVEDKYHRLVPKPSRGTKRLDTYTASSTIIKKGFLELYDKIGNKKLKIKKLNLTVGNLTDKKEAEKEIIQMNLFNDIKEEDQEAKKEKSKKEENIQIALVNIKEKYGKNAIFKGLDLLEGATSRERNEQIGGHRG